MKHIKKTFFFVLIFSVLFLGGCAFGTSGERDQAPGGDVQEEEAQNEASSEKEQSSSPKVVFEALDMEGNTVSYDILAYSNLTMIIVCSTFCNPCLS